LARLARIVLPGIPYHAARHRREPTFFEDGDYGPKPKGNKGLLHVSP
jgi:hypothetical protein